MMLTATASRAPEWVISQAHKKIAQYIARSIFPRKIITTGFLSLAVNHRWRLLSKDGGNKWQLMTHERYNGAKDGR